MENVLQEVESKALRKLDGLVDYTWVEKHNQNGGQIMFKLFDRSNMLKAQDILKKEFKNTPDTYYHISNWNPAELPLPKEEHFKAVIKGDDFAIFNTTSRLKTFLQEKDIYDVDVYCKMTLLHTGIWIGY